MSLFQKSSIPCLATLLLAGAARPHPARAGDFPADPLGWPAVTATNKPWTRWWWLGSAVDKPNLTRQLEDFANHGLGGVEICPIYGAVGAEDRELQFLSPPWMAMLAHTTREAQRLDLGVDMTTGTGWPFGGPQVTPDIASAGLTLIHRQANGGARIKLTLPKGKLQCLRAYQEGAPPIDLAPLVMAESLDWMAPAGKWEIVGLSSLSPVQQVKRAAPGGEGNVLDPFSATAMTEYLARFDEAFNGFNAPLPRAQFHDSFEYYAAEWTPALFETFLTNRHYDLRDQLPAVAGLGDPDTVSRVRADYRETLGELHLAYLERWHDWAKSRGGITRNQAHGSPGNLLDHYAVSEIPETEIFRHVEESQIPMLRIAASAAQSKGDKLVSAESFTWLDEHFQVTPEKLKEAADFVFLGGVNHIFFHGTPYSPDDAKWPGWLFYASTHMGQNGGLWHDLSAFTGYLQRCQSILQEGEFSSDVLLYFPIDDLWHNSRDKLPLFTVHNQEEWLHPTRLYQTSMVLWRQGIPFNYASGTMLSRATVRDGDLILGGHAYRTLVLPGLTRISPETMKTITGLSARGARVIVQGAWPTDVPGFHDVAKRRASLLALESEADGRSTVVRASDSILPSLASLGVRPEPMVRSGLRFVRRSHVDGYHYFIVNRSDKTFDGKVPLSVPFQSAAILDPWNPAHNGIAPIGNSGISLHLAPGESTIVRTFSERKVEGNPVKAHPSETQTIPIDGPWNLKFIDGGPTLPAAVESIKLGSWTTFPDANAFSGTARYTTTFDMPSTAAAYFQLDLGTVANTARVSLNGHSLGISWCAPHLMDVSNAIKPGKNLLEIEVTNLAANRIADLDRRKVPWKQFHEINFVNIDYKLFDASDWPARDSGLLGPVRLLISK